MTAGREDQFGQLNGQDDTPDAFVSYRPEQVDPADTQGPTVNVLGIDGEKWGEGGLQDDAFFSKGKGDPQEHHGAPALPLAPHQFTNEQCSAAIDTYLRQQEEESGEVRRAKKEFANDRR